MKYRVIALGLSSGLSLLANPACAQSDVKDWGDQSGKDSGKLIISLAVATTNVEVNLENSEVILPEDFEFGEFEATLNEDVNFTSLFTGASASYRILPFLTIDARAGFVASESDFDVTVTGTPGEQFPDFLQGPISISSPVSTNVEGVNAGIGATVVFPVLPVGDSVVLMYGSYEHSWSEYNDDNFSANFGRITSGFIFPLSLRDKSQPIFTLGASYTDVSRSFEREFDLNGETAIVRAEQTTDHPYSAEWSAILPLSQEFRIGLGGSVQTTGNVSFLATLTFIP